MNHTIHDDLKYPHYPHYQNFMDMMKESIHPGTYLDSPCNLPFHNGYRIVKIPMGSSHTIYFHFLGNGRLLGMGHSAAQAQGFNGGAEHVD